DATKGLFAIGVLGLDRASAVMLKAGSVAAGAIRSIELGCDRGVCAPGATVRCRWDTDITDLTGTIEALGDVPIAGATGMVDFTAGPGPDRKRMPSRWYITIGTSDREGQLLLGSVAKACESTGCEQGPWDLASVIPDDPWRAADDLAVSG